MHLAALTLAAGLAVHLALNLAVTAVRAERERRRQHQLIALLGDPIPGEPRTRVLAHPVPLAYCVPGIRTATVLTDGLVDTLRADELAAVIAHERTHLDQLHHLVLLAFRAWHSALPWFPIANRAERAVAQLTEMLADDGARRATGDDPVRRADRAGRLGRRARCLCRRRAVSAPISRCLKHDLRGSRRRPRDARESSPSVTRTVSGLATLE